MSAPKLSAVNPLLLKRQKTMEANVARLQDLFKQKVHVVGMNKQDFAQLAHNLVYGAMHKVTMPNNQDTHQKDQGNEPTYEPDAAETDIADDDLPTDEVESSVAKDSAKVIKYLLL
jgi:hypothetical protein